MHHTGAQNGGSSIRLVGAELVVLSFVVLFQELTLIRWLPAHVRVLAYFPNLVLIGAFLGLGVGALRARGRLLLWLWPFAVGATVGVAVWLGGIAFTANELSEHLWLLYSDLPLGARVVRGIRAPIIGLFALTAFSFVPLGQAVGKRLTFFQERSKPLWGYLFDLLGSLLGVVAFALTSLTGAFPFTWFMLLLAAGSPFFLRTRRLVFPFIIVASGIVWGVHEAERAQIYSPYYALSAVPVDGTPDYLIRTNGSLHQVAVGLREDAPTLTVSRERAREGYHLPYKLLGRPLGKVLVLGAGTGNDISVLLDEGAEEIHAVEIDPEIIQLGRQLHPDKPWDDARVTVINTDARSYLHETNETYDLIVFGTLDSMTRLSALSNVRLDNFVYTQESIRAASKVLKTDGGMVLYFLVGKDYLFYNIAALLYTGFGELPVVLGGNWEVFSHIFLAGPAFASARGAPGTIDLRPFLGRIADASIPSDDWPYLYLAGRGVSAFYVSLMVVFFALATLAVLSASRELLSSTIRRKADIEMFLFGFAFLLLETRFVTAMSLLWGATWITSAVVFGGILAMVLLFTLVTEFRPPRWGVAISGLISSLVIVYLIPTESLLAENILVRLVLSSLFVGVPVAFAAVCFASRFRLRREVDLAFGWNLLGAVAGGLVEFMSMAVGLRALVILVIGAYLGVAALVQRDGVTDKPALGSL